MSFPERRLLTSSVMLSFSGIPGIMINKCGKIKQCIQKKNFPQKYETRTASPLHLQRMRRSKENTALKSRHPGRRIISTDHCDELIPMSRHKKEIRPAPAPKKTEPLLVKNTPENRPESKPENQEGRQFHHQAFQ